MATEKAKSEVKGRDNNSDRGTPPWTSVREPVTGPSWPYLPDHGGARIFGSLQFRIWLVLLAAWVLYSRFFFLSPYFKDPDSARFAFGLAQKLQGIGYSDGMFHQLDMQYGAYVLFYGLAKLFFIDPSGIQQFMTIVSVVSMIGIIALSFSLGYMIWGIRTALVSTTLLALSPMMWIAGQYPTVLIPAFFVFMLAVWAMVMSYRVRGGRWWLVASAILFAFSILIRVELIFGMLVPVCYAFFVDRRGLRRALILYVITALVLTVFWVFVWNVDMDSLFAFGPHQPDYGKSVLMNWWGMGPFLFVFAFFGFLYRFVTDRKPLPFIFFWIVGFNTFYTGHLTSPRNFILYYPVVSWLAAFSVIALYTWFARKIKLNKPLRIAAMVLLSAGALTMLTMSTIKTGDGVKIAWGDTVSYARSDGLSPTGSAWFYMQDFRVGDGFQYGWIEDGAREAADTVFNPESDVFIGFNPPIFAGKLSQVYLNYHLLASGWKMEEIRGSFIIFRRPVRSSGENIPTVSMQTYYVDDPPAEDIGFVGSDSTLNVVLARDALPIVHQTQGEDSAAILKTSSGWHVAHSLSGLDFLTVDNRGALYADGALQCETEFMKFFHTDPTEIRHVQLVPPESDSRPSAWTYSGGVVSVHNGESYSDYDNVMLKGVTEITWSSHTDPHKWAVLAMMIDSPEPVFEIFIGQSPISRPQWIANNISGIENARWHLMAIPPGTFTGDETEFRLTMEEGDIYDIYLVQRSYPDCQFRNETAIPLDLEFSTYDCDR